MLVWMDGDEDNRAPTGDEAIRARLIQNGSIRTRTSRQLEVIRKAFAAVHSGKTSDYISAFRNSIERILRAYEPEVFARSEGPGAVIARVLRIKNLVIDLSASMASRVKSALASPTVKSIGFYSSLKLAGHNAP